MMNEAFLKDSSKDDLEQQQHLEERLLTNEAEQAEPVPRRDTTTTIVVPDDAAHYAGHYRPSSSSSYHHVPGEVQPHRFRDAWAAVLFVAHQVVIAYVAVHKGYPQLRVPVGDNNSKDDGAASVSFTGTFALLTVCALGTVLLTTLLLGVLVQYVSVMLQVTLALSLLGNVLVVLYSFAQGSVVGGIAALLLLLWHLWYVYRIWRRIPFATSILMTAGAALAQNGGILVAALAGSLLHMLWSLMWLLAVVGVYVRNVAVCDMHGDDLNTDATVACELNVHDAGGPTLLFLLLLSYSWTSQVIQNVTHVSVAGVVGTFIFCPDEACTFWSPAIADSIWRATTYSFGSVCVGSLVTATIQVLHQIVRSAQRHNRCSATLMCVLECLLRILQRASAYFNKWSMTYTGLYGYDYWTAGHKVLALFRDRGWTLIINDDIVHRALFLLSVVLGLLTGCLGIMLYHVKPGWVDEFGSGLAPVVAFVLPALVGLTVATTLMQTVASAADTVIVTFAEAPLQLERNHPGLYTQMANAWRQVYPSEFQF